MPAPVLLLHLSDIHFWRWRLDDSTYDVDTDLRRQLERDAEALRNRLGPFTGIVVTGDIAYSADPREYKAAEDWLKELCARIGCEEQAVWTVPGNHDVSRKVIDESPMTAMAQQQLRKDAGSLPKLLADPIGQNALFTAIENYNEFAGKFECHFGPKRLVWHDELELNDGSKLRLAGLNSTLASWKGDDANNKGLVLCDIAHCMPEENGVAYLTLCHHPPEWLIDLDATDDLLTNRAHVQLFGHKHRQRVRQIGKMLRITAGAVHPDRGEREWTPGYNVLSISVDGTNAARVLSVSLFSRVWNQSGMRFVADTAGCGKEECVHTVPLDPWDGPASRNVSTAPSAGPAADDEKKKESGNAVSPKGPSMDPSRRLTYRFLTLPHPQRMTIAVKLALVADDDAGLTDRELFARIFSRARERTQLAALWAAVEEQHGQPNSAPNPFAGR